MMKHNGILIVAVLVANSAGVGAGEVRTLCEAGESTYLSCSVGTKLVSVCGSKELTAESGYLRYLFGKPGKKPELIYPADHAHPSLVFRRNEPVSSAKSGVMALAFDVSGYTYNVFTTRSAFGYNGAGVLIQKGEKQVALKSCTPQTINDEKFLFGLSKVGIPIGSVRYVGPEQ